MPLGYCTRFNRMETSDQSNQKFAPLAIWRWIARSAIPIKGASDYSAVRSTALHTAVLVTGFLFFLKEILPPLRPLRPLTMPVIQLQPRDGVNICSLRLPIEHADASLPNSFRMLCSRTASNEFRDREQLTRRRQRCQRKSVLFATLDSTRLHAAWR